MSMYKLRSIYEVALITFICNCVMRSNCCVIMYYFCGEYLWFVNVENYLDSLILKYVEALVFSCSNVLIRNMLERSFDVTFFFGMRL